MELDKEIIAGGMVWEVTRLKHVQYVSHYMHASFLILFINFNF
jgi:hypothetical protein